MYLDNKFQVYRSIIEDFENLRRERREGDGFGGLGLQEAMELETAEVWRAWRVGLY